MLDNINIIAKASRLLGIPKTNVKNIFKDKTNDEALQILNDIESMAMANLDKRLNLNNLYESFRTEYIKNEINVGNISIDDYTANDEIIMRVTREASKIAKEKWITYLKENDKSIKVNCSGKNITSRCSKLPHAPHYDINNKTFCCGVNGDIELIDYTVRITSLVHTIKGNRNRRSSMRSGYRIQIIEPKVEDYNE